MMHETNRIAEDINTFPFRLICVHNIIFAVEFHGVAMPLLISREKKLFNLKLKHDKC